MYVSSRMLCFYYLVTTGWNSKSAYLRIQSKSIFISSIIWRVSCVRFLPDAIFLLPCDHGLEFEISIFEYNARKGFHNATGGNVTQTEWSDDKP